MYGIQLEKWAPNSNDGVVDQSRYFQAKSGHGYFATSHEITDEPDEKKSEVDKQQFTRIRKIFSGNKTPAKSSTFKIGDKVKSIDGQSGVVKLSLMTPVNP